MTGIAHTLAVEHLMKLNPQLKKLRFRKVLFAAMKEYDRTYQSHESFFAHQEWLGPEDVGKVPDAFHVEWDGDRLKVHIVEVAYTHQGALSRHMVADKYGPLAELFDNYCYFGDLYLYIYNEEPRLQAVYNTDMICVAHQYNAEPKKMEAHLVDLSKEVRCPTPFDEVFKVAA